MMVLRCGYTTAIDLCLTGKMITGKQAADYKLINRAVPDIETLKKDVRDLANGLALYPKDGIRSARSCGRCCLPLWVWIEALWTTM